MAGEHILKLLVEEPERISVGDRWLVCKKEYPVIYCVYERKPYKRHTHLLIETKDEELACRVLKSK